MTRAAAPRARRTARASHGFPRARKRFGQHFLEPAWVARVLARIAPEPSETIVEIGPGRGALTRLLADRVGTLVCVEIDRDLATALPHVVPPEVRIVESDVLRLDLAALVAPSARPFRVVGNLPYNVASPILFALLRASGHGAVIRDAVVMLQREVAERLVAAPGSAAYGALAIQVGLVADAAPLLDLPPGAFRPPPKVHSTLVSLRFREPACPAGPRDTFERLVRGVFLQRRKMLANALAPVASSLGDDAGRLLAVTGIDGTRRPQDLTVADYAALSRAVL